MSAIGPGDWVQAVTSIGRTDTDPQGALTEGAIYQVREVGETKNIALAHCDARMGIKLVGQPNFFRRLPEGVLREMRWCACRFRLWPPPADEALKDEEAPQDADPVSVPA